MLATACTLLVSSVWGQITLLNGPEGIAYDTGSQSYFVTNATDGKIIKIDNSWTQSIIYEGLNVPMGIHYVGDTLWVSSNDPSTISCINASSGELLGSFEITESQSMAHMDYDPRGHRLYVIGQQGQCFRVDTETLVYDEFIPAGSGLSISSQTCSVDTLNNCLYVFSWPATYVRKVNLDDPGDIENVVNPGWGQYIDCVSDPDGNIYVSSWQDNLIHVYAPGCGSQPAVFSTGYDKPAGLVYNPDQNSIAICNYEGNYIDEIELGTTGTNDKSGHDVVLNIFPNPVHSSLHFSCNLPGSSNLEIIVFTMQGKMVYSGMIDPASGRAYTHTISSLDFMPGVYSLVVRANGRTYASSRFIKL